MPARPLRPDREVHRAFRRRSAAVRGCEIVRYDRQARAASDARLEATALREPARVADLHLTDRKWLVVLDRYHQFGSSLLADLDACEQDVARAEIHRRLRENSGCRVMGL